MLTKLRSGLPLTISTGGTTLPQTEVGFNEIGVPSVPEHFGKPSVLWAAFWHGRRSVRAEAFTALNVVNRNNPSSLTLAHPTTFGQITGAGYARVMQFA